MAQIPAQNYDMMEEFPLNIYTLGLTLYGIYASNFTLYFNCMHY